MYYAVTQSIPPGTSKQNPVKTTVEIHENFLEAIFVQIPPGVLGLAGFRIKLGEWSFFPRGENQWVTGDGLSEIFTLAYPLSYVPSEFKIEFYNEDDTYTHTITLGFLAVTKELATVYIPMTTWGY